MTLPNFVVIGAMKCGTTALAAQLAAQEGIFISDPKEPNFFSNDEEYAKGLTWYESLFEAASGAQLRGEASTHYTKLPTYPKTLPRFREVFEDVRLIYMMRHPIDRLVSQFIHEWSQRSVSDPIEKELEKKSWMIDYGRYAMQVTPWIELYGAERVLPVFSERIRAAPQQELVRVCAFLGYEGKPRWADLGDHNVTSQRLRTSPVRDALLDLPGLKQLRQGLTPQGVRDWAKRFWRMNHPPELTPDRVQELEAEYDKDLAVLGDMLCVKLCCANYKDVVMHSPLSFESVGSVP